MIGLRFGKLVVGSFAFKHKTNRQDYWNCICDCGKLKIINGCSLRADKSKSCGCSRKTHGHSSENKRSLTYRSWESMCRRCLTVKEDHPDFKLYKGRGIQICERWLKFDNFLADMGERPEKMSLDRIDVNGNCPENCKWSSNLEQCRHKRTAVLLTYKGETLLMSEWERRFDLGTGTLRTWVRQYGNDKAIEYFLSKTKLNIIS
jgi:hypothetical protein